MWLRSDDMCETFTDNSTATAIPKAGLLHNSHEDFQGRGYAMICVKLVNQEKIVNSEF